MEYDERRRIDAVRGAAPSARLTLVAHKDVAVAVHHSGHREHGRVRHVQHLTLVGYQQQRPVAHTGQETSHIVRRRLRGRRRQRDTALVPRLAALELLAGRARLAGHRLRPIQQRRFQLLEFGFGARWAQGPRISIVLVTGGHRRQHPRIQVFDRIVRHHVRRSGLPSQLVQLFAVLARQPTLRRIAPFASPAVRTVFIQRRRANQKRRRVSGSVCSRSVFTKLPAPDGSALLGSVPSGRYVIPFIFNIILVTGVKTLQYYPGSKWTQTESQGKNGNSGFRIRIISFILERFQLPARICR